LNGFLAQVTNFPFEIIIRDDASTDGTREIVREYAAAYPRIIRTVIETENQHSKGIRANPAIAPHAKGEFIALCEGDDYWISSDKLEKQMRLLKGYPAATMCVARTVMCKYENDRLVCDIAFAQNQNSLQYFEDIKGTYFHTSTYLLRTELYKKVLGIFKEKNIEYGDTALRFMLIDYGPFVNLSEVVSVYRVTGSGIWTSLNRTKQLEWEIKCTEALYQHMDSKFRKYFGQKLFNCYFGMARQGVLSFNGNNPMSNISRLIQLSLMYFPGLFSTRLARRIKRIF
jgi:glycosyltransferase involved in cell wall biosynthesis